MNTGLSDCESTKSEAPEPLRAAFSELWRRARAAPPRTPPPRAKSIYCLLGCTGWIPENGGERFRVTRFAYKIFDDMRAASFCYKAATSRGARNIKLLLSGIGTSFGRSPPRERARDEAAAAGESSANSRQRRLITAEFVNCRSARVDYRGKRSDRER
ncbi:hypothetical protein EVAR_49783_1 [Eumeta japonica]|uniref:Uncharacterized protein n=1 Tax=Eumeta variegata TaxID=151549 RepID=A0A4C1Y1D9_EUMVA|nr:hypothetical protein EVAR_49783_1 [Eumeta japonica]